MKWCDRGGAEMEVLLGGILERTKFAYIPLEYYDRPRHRQMLPETITLNRLIVPFDIMSRTLMIATANPFDALGNKPCISFSITTSSGISPSPVRSSKCWLNLTKQVARVLPASAPRSPRRRPAPVPPLAVTPAAAPLQSADKTPAAPLPDTSAFQTFTNEHQIPSENASPMSSSRTVFSCPASLPKPSSSRSSKAGAC